MSLTTAFNECMSYQVSLKKDWYQLGLTTKGEFIDMAKRHNYRNKNAAGRSVGYCFYLGLQKKLHKFKND